ncbi:hypothetical protein EIP91_008129 [Steccherinum ochraceum]|uniref:DUF6534 domain-containing protein n=1 Tax=Steccherinum ochraceum TaxID=92696 RepID=A0A4R0R393_9APHY|nr:hypothetical protein EIP91_008129 [Steccherinum ochraceum]
MSSLSPSDPGAGAGLPAGTPGAPAVDTTLLALLGPLLVGGLMSMVLYGITCAQTFVFYQKSLADRWPLKLTVFVLWFIDTFDVFLNGHILYYYLVVNFLNPLALTVPVWSILLHVTVTAVSNCISVYHTSLANEREKLDSVYIHQLATSIVITAKAFGRTFIGLQALSSLFYTDFAAVLAADLTVALSLTYFLHISRTGLKKTESLINVLILYTINTGLLTALDSSAGLVLFVVMPNNLVYVAFYLQLSKLYVNAYLATLNARETLRDRSVNEHVSIHLSQISGSHGGHSNQFTPSYEPTLADKVQYISEGCYVQRSNPLAITVTTHVDEMLEEDDLKQRKGWGPVTHAV